MKNLSNQFWIKLKGILFLVIGVICASLVLLDNFKWQTALYLILAIWSFCRFYYFAFYVIEKYVDPGYKFSGLYSFLKYMLQRRKR
jgi:hypothetical protein